jgi:hypothetical protein
VSPEQYQPNKEAALLNQKNIRVLPIGRQTEHVAGSQSVGRTDGTTNAKAIIDAFGTEVLGALPQGLAVFLDVEGPPHLSLSVDYYKGWADGSLKRHGQPASSSSRQSTEHKGTVPRGHIWRRPFQTAQPARAPGSRAPARLGAIRSGRSRNCLCARRAFPNRSRSWHGRPC